ncbi:Brp/Blh family beta-carotene 15,15'-dioxygenase [Gammaproteobacteria bacterium]|nr:Brp/Blh family beta-carotene 15,15'-dioxygenase [Gammaproteobacteria bacterium]
MASAVTSNLHSVVFSLTAALVIVLTSHAVFSIFSQLMILTGAVMLAGLPHGALDPLVSNYLMGASSFRKRSLFYLNYLLKASMAFIFWLWQPEIMLLLFFVFSAWHFSDDWRETLPRLHQIGVGISMVILPIFFRPLDTALLFSYLGADWPEPMIRSVSFLPGIFCCVIMILAISYTTRNRPWMSFELLSLCALAALTSPLIFFSVYFCLLHSPRHIMKVVKVLKISARKALLYAIVFTFLAVVITIFALGSRVEINSASGLTQAVFIGLFCLTVPHMFLIHHFQRKSATGD